jgi:hypothetical protein
MAAQTPHKQPQLDVPHPNHWGEVGGIFLVLLICLGLAWLCGYGLYFCAGDVVNQHTILTTYVPVEARVRSVSSTEMGPGKKIRDQIEDLLFGTLLGRGYRVSVQYDYSVGGQPYSGRQLEVPLATTDPTAAQSWARSIAATYPSNQPCEAYHDPDDPSRSFLVRDYGFAPYACTYFCLLGTCFFGGLTVNFLFLLIWRAVFRQPVGSALPEWTFGLSVVPALTVYIVVGALLLGHYFLVATRPFARDSSPIWVLVLYLGPLLIWLGVILYRVIAGPPRETAPATVPVKQDPREARRAERKRERLAKKRNR